MSANAEYTQKIGALAKSGHVELAQRHIEVDRAYRDISRADCLKALENGRVIAVQADTIDWEGQDVDGRKLKLLCYFSDTKGQFTMSIVDAELVTVTTAYSNEPGDKGKDRDTEIRKEWLKANPSWREKPNGHVEKIK